MSYPYIMQGNNIVVVIDNVTHTISNSHISFNEVREAIKNDEWDRVKEIIEPVNRVLEFGRGNISIKDDVLYWKDRSFHNALSRRMVDMLREGFSVEPLAAFMENLMNNPSRTSVEELYGFLEKNSLPITPDGHFLAYKKVRDNYKDIHSGTFDNSVGAVCEMPRNEVDDNRNRTCSAGLHFCSKDYLPHFGTGPGNRVMIVKINPADVVSIPSDYDNSKGRAWRYEVVGELNVGVDDAFTRSVQDNANSDLLDDSWLNDDSDEFTSDSWLDDDSWDDSDSDDDYGW